MMCDKWSPHARYRLYTSRESYWLPFFDQSGAIETFEAEVSRRFHVKAAVCVPMARTGLLLVLKEMIRPGQTVIMSPLTIVDVVNAVLLAGGIPTFVDITRRSCSLDPELVERAIDRSTGAVLIPHLHGQAAGATTLRLICANRGVPLIEDAAQAFGAIEHGKPVGTIGNAGIYSFGFYKHLTTWRGGMVVSNDTALVERIRGQVRWMPELSRSHLLFQTARGFAVDVATWPPFFHIVTHPIVRQNIYALDRHLDPEANATRLKAVPLDHLRRMRSSQAKIGIQQLDRLESDIQDRVARASRYHESLEACSELIMPMDRNDGSNIYTYFPIQVRDRGGLLRHARRQRRDFAAQHLRNCADLDLFSEFSRLCPEARAASQELVLLPTYPRYPVSEVQKNIDVIQEWLSKYKVKGWKTKKDARSNITSASITERASPDRPTTAIR